MLTVPKYVLKKLNCSKCLNYLNCGPILISRNQEQFCGQCSRILTEDIKSECVRETGLEAIAEILNFPCKYNIQGCPEIFPYNTGWEHEKTCSYKNNTISTIRSNLTLKSSRTYETEELQMTSLCSNSDDKLKINMEIAAKAPNKLNLNSEEIKVNLEVAISTEDNPQITYSHLRVEKITEENFYDSVVYSANLINCVNCKQDLIKADIFLCPFGHYLCRLCKNSVCSICETLPNSSSFCCCKNFDRGCTGLFATSDISKHEIDCEFNNFHCLKCDYKSFLAELVEHFVKNHEVVLGNELVVTLGRNDQEWYFYCNNKLFCCIYYNYGDNFDVLVAYIGSNENAKNHKYEVTLMNKNPLKKKSKCLGWNDIYLEKGINFEVANNLRTNLQVKIVIL